MPKNRFADQVPVATAPIPVQSVTSLTPTIEPARDDRGPWWEPILAVVVCPALVAIAVGLILWAVAL